MYGAQKMKVLTKMPRSDQAMDTMKRIADQVKPLCVKYKWTVRSFEEFFPDNNGLLGMNVNWGQKIFVRLRSGHDDFMLYERVLATMLHELTHMEHGNHSADFYRFLDALTDECDALIRKGIRGSNMPWQGEGKSLGGSNGAITAADPKAAAAAAAERRARAAGIMMGSGGQRLGGHGSICGGSCSSGTAKPTPETLRKLRLSAAQRRLADNQTCVATQDGASCEYSSQHQYDSSSDNDDDADAMSDNTSTAAAGDSSSNSNSSVLTQSQMVGDDSEPGSWACDRCTLINEAAATRCSVCGADYGNSSTNADSGSNSDDDDSNTTTTSSSTAAAASSSKSKSKSTTRHPLSNSRNTNSTSSGSSSSAKAVVKAAAASASTTVKASALRPDMPAQAARWRCDQCSFINSAFSERCTALGCRGEQQQQTTPILSTATTTAAVGMTNSSSSSGATPTKQQQQQQFFDSPLCATAAELTQWSCVVCTLVNRPLALVCECCDAIRDVSSTTNNSSGSAGSGAGTGSSASSSVQQQQQQQSALSREKRKLTDAEGADKQGEVVDMTGFD
jgi:DNA-dependent metalloprotease WSS1